MLFTIFLPRLLCRTGKTATNKRKELREKYEAWPLVGVPLIAECLRFTYYFFVRRWKENA